jgi:hypothetical protein
MTDGDVGEYDRQLRGIAVGGGMVGNPRSPVLFPRVEKINAVKPDSEFAFDGNFFASEPSRWAVREHAGEPVGTPDDCREPVPARTRSGR